MSRKKVVVISQARMNSSRLPEKVLKTINDHSLVYYHFERLRRAKRVDEVRFAIPDSAENDILQQHLQQLGALVSRGPEEDTLQRYAIAATEAQADIVIRVTSDCPFIAPELIDQAIQTFQSQPKADYGFIDLTTCARGFDVEIFTAATLFRAVDEAEEQHEREHVTPYIYTHPERFELLPMTSGLTALQDGRVCVDTDDDFQVASAIIEHFGEDILNTSADAIMRFLEQRDDLRQLNQHIGQIVY